MLDVEKNDEEGFQAEFGNVLLTLMVNPNHGISGSIAIKGEGQKVRLLEFHGSSPQEPFPLHLHESEGQLPRTKVRGL